jgi:hypothetical protein
VNLLELFFQRCKANKAANDLLDNAALASRPLSAKEQLEFENLVSAITELDRQIEERSALAA